MIGKQRYLGGKAMATEAQKKARNKHNKENMVNKTISFSKNTDKEILDYISNLDVAFGTYVKKLIKEEIKKH